MRQGTVGRSAVKRGDRSDRYYLDRIGAARRIMPDDINKSAVVSRNGAGGKSVDRDESVEGVERDMQQQIWTDADKDCIWGEQDWSDRDGRRRNAVLPQSGGSEKWDNCGCSQQ